MTKVMNGTHSAAKTTVSKKAYAKLLKIADENGLLKNGRKNFDRHYSDGEDFFETSVWTMNKVLQEAYQAGYDAAKAIKGDA